MPTIWACTVLIIPVKILPTCILILPQTLRRSGLRLLKVQALRGLSTAYL